MTTKALPFKTGDPVWIKIQFVEEIVRIGWIQGEVILTKPRPDAFKNDPAIQLLRSIASDVPNGYYDVAALGWVEINGVKMKDIYHVKYMPDSTKFNEVVAREGKFLSNPPEEPYTKQVKEKDQPSPNRVSFWDSVTPRKPVTHLPPDPQIQVSDGEKAENQKLLERAELLRKLVEDHGINLNIFISALWLALDEVPHAQWMPEQLQAVQDFSTLIQWVPRPFKK